MAAPSISIYANCFGCKENLPNQSAHMHFGGGCLYEYEEEKEEKEEKELNKIEKKKLTTTLPKLPKTTKTTNGIHH